MPVLPTSRSTSTTCRPRSKARKAHGFSPIGEVIVIDDGPNRGRQVVYLKGPDGFVVEFIGDRPA